MAFYFRQIFPQNILFLFISWKKCCSMHHPHLSLPFHSTTKLHYCTHCLHPCVLLNYPVSLLANSSCNGKCLSWHYVIIITHVTGTSTNHARLLGLVLVCFYFPHSPSLEHNPEEKKPLNKRRKKIFCLLASTLKLKQQHSSIYCLLPSRVSSAYISVLSL